MKKLLASLGLASVLMAGTAHASVTINPQRVVFSGPDRSAELTLANPTNERQVYRLEWVQLTMEQDGALRMAAPGEAKQPAADMVRFSPRQVTIEPGKSQKIRLSLRKPDGLADGEYRSHLRIVTDKGVDSLPPANAPVSPSGEEGMSVRIVMNYGTSVPVTVLNGAAKGGAALASAKAGKEGVMVKINRDGNAGVVGDLVLLSGGKELAQQRGVGVYANLNSRDAVIPYKGKAPAGTKVEYRDAITGKVLAATTLN